MADREEIMERLKKRYGSEGWKEIPQELIRNADHTRGTIEWLKGFLKIQEGKYVTSKKGLVNKVKFYFLGYVHVQEEKGYA